MSSPPQIPAEPPPSPTTNFFEGILDWFLPDALRFDPEATRRARLVVASALLLASVQVLVLAMIDWVPGRPWMGIYLPRPIVTFLMLAVLFNLGVAVVVQRTGNPRTGAFFLTATLTVVFASMSFLQSGYEGPVTWWLAAVPMVSALLSGPRATLLTAAVVTLVLFTLYALDANGLGPGAHIARETTSQDVLRAQVLLLGFISFFGWYYERTRVDASHDLMGAYAELERTNAALRMSQQNVRQIAENVGQALWMHDLRTDRVVYANPGFDEVFQLSRTRLAADADVWTGRVHPDDLSKIPVDLDGRDHVYRVEIGDEQRWLRHAVYPVGDVTTSTHRAIHLVADITLKRTADALRDRYLETVLEVQENERRHLARELHDDTGQHLTALLVGLKALANTLEGDAQRDLAQQLADQLRGVVKDISRLSRGLHPQVLDELGLVTGVERLADEARDATQATVKVRAQGREHEDALSPTVRLTAYRIVQEALTNIMRHAEAETVDIQLDISGDRLSVRVEDDGRGFDPAAPAHRHELSSGLGLVGMKERVAMLGGQVTVESAPGMGTTVIGELPNRTRGANTAA